MSEQYQDPTPLFKKRAPVQWHCINCGYIFEGAPGATGMPGLPAPDGLLRGPGRELL